MQLRSIIAIIDATLVPAPIQHFTKEEKTPLDEGQASTSTSRSTFSWSNEARGKAAVHCVIVGFGLHDVADKVIYEYEDVKGPLVVPAAHINPYLVYAPV